MCDGALPPQVTKEGASVTPTPTEGERHSRAKGRGTPVRGRIEGLARRQFCHLALAMPSLKQLLRNICAFLEHFNAHTELLATPPMVDGVR